ncbi:IS5 family transposase [Candidatus Poribacteria bacterium]|nr:IS5 family transposase [Candidatus Poribacteria bacterium]
MTDVEKKLNKRWGKEHEDNRDWPVYNGQLIKRGEYFLDLDWVKGWDNELDAMNQNKVGAPFQFPESMIRMQSVWHAIGVPLRTIEGITIQLRDIAELPAYNDFSTIGRRINDMDATIAPPPGGASTMFCDGSGFQAISGGEYLREKYGKKNRRWVQVIILGDPVTKEPVSFEVRLIPSSEPESAIRQLDRLKEQGAAPQEFGGDGAFDDSRIWKLCEKRLMRPVIKPDENARTDGDSPLRNYNAAYRKKNGYEGWARHNGYGRRWPATEGIFSAVKRMFGEQLAAKSEIGMVQEAKIKFWAYKLLKNYGEAQ